MNKKNKLTERIEVRCTTEEKNIIKTLAMMYSNNNISAYIIDRVLYSNRKIIKEKNFELSNRRIKRESKSSP